MPEVTLSETFNEPLLPVFRKRAQPIFMFRRLLSSLKAKPPIPPKPAREIRDTLFGDAPMDEWPPETFSINAFPWDAFRTARESVAKSDTASAIECWKSVISASDLESRHYVQAWHFLRLHGCQPPAEVAKTLLGVVIEVGMPRGLDLLAAYPEHTARYYNFSAAGVVWEHPDISLDPLIDTLLAVSAKVVAHIGPWEKERPAAPKADHIRLSFLTPSGLHFGEGEFSALSADPMGGTVIKAATALMLALMEKGKGGQKK